MTILKRDEVWGERILIEHSLICQNVSVAVVLSFGDGKKVETDRDRQKQTDSNRL